MEQLACRVLGVERRWERRGSEVDGSRSHWFRKTSVSRLRALRFDYGMMDSYRRAWFALDQDQVHQLQWSFSSYGGGGGRDELQTGGWEGSEQAAGGVQVRDLCTWMRKQCWKESIKINLQRAMQLNSEPVVMLLAIKVYLIYKAFHIINACILMSLDRCVLSLSLQSLLPSGLQSVSQVSAGMWYHWPHPGAFTTHQQAYLMCQFMTLSLSFLIC